MAGMMLSILKAHNEHVFPEILGTKTARDSIAHGGTSRVPHSLPPDLGHAVSLQRRGLVLTLTIGLERTHIWD